MLKKIILGSIALCCLLNAEVNTNNQPQELEFQKVLKSLQEKKSNDNLPILPLDTTSNSTVTNDLNVIGTVTIGMNKYCYLLVEGNKVIKATNGMTIKNKKIEEISDYGITVSDKNKTTYLPILSAQVQESDIAFSNRDVKK